MRPILPHSIDEACNNNSWDASVLPRKIRGLSRGSTSSRDAASAKDSIVRLDFLFPLPIYQLFLFGSRPTLNLQFSASGLEERSKIFLINKLHWPSLFRPQGCFSCVMTSDPFKDIVCGTDIIASVYALEDVDVKDLIHTERSKTMSVGKHQPFDSRTRSGHSPTAIEGTAVVEWRRVQDSNLRRVSPYWFSRPAP